MSRKTERYKNDPEFRRKHLENNKLYRCIKNRGKVKKPDTAQPEAPKRPLAPSGMGYMGSLQGQVNTEHQAGGN